MIQSPSRIHQYKNGGHSPANFRDSLRKKCMERLKDNRFDRQNNRRRLNFGPDHKEILENTVKEEMEGASFEEQLAMLEELEEEIRREIEEYEAQLAQEEEFLASHLDPDAFCPSCKRHPMDVDHTGCLCKKCGFKYEFRNGSVPSKTELAEKLVNGFEAHGNTECNNMPEPIQSHEGLFLYCNSCEKSVQVL